MDTRTGDIRELQAGERLRDYEVLLNEAEATRLREFRAEERFAQYQRDLAGATSKNNGKRRRAAKAARRLGQ